MTEAIRNTAHSTFQRLLNLAKANKEDFNLMLSRYGMERFLYRLSISPYIDQFILKGASLFLVWQGRNYRVTKDADLLGFGDPDAGLLLDIFKDVCLIECLHDDGMDYLPKSVKIETIREDQVYDGVRITLIGLLNQARIHLQIDIGFGDIVIPAPELIKYPTLLDAPPPRMKAYSRYTLIAEKLEIMVKLGIANSRMKDFYDIQLLSRLFNFESKILGQAITNTFSRRDTPLPVKEPFAFTAEFYEDTQKQHQWKAFIRKSRPDEIIDDLKVLITEISAFVMPIFKELNQDSDTKRIWSINRGWVQIV